MRPLSAGFLRSADRFPDRPAVEVEGLTLSYRELLRRAGALAAAARREAPAFEPPLTALYAHRSVTAFSGVLAALLRGTGYVPLNPFHPPSRVRDMLLASMCRVVILDSTAELQIEETLREIDRSLVLLFPERSDITNIAKRLSRHKVLGRDSIVDSEPCKPATPDPGSIAYLLFTSGSTGQPKGVMVSNANATRFVDLMVDRYGIKESDRFSQMFEMGFDLSVFDMFVAWERGACVCCPTRPQVMLPADYIRKSGITIWFSVPSSVLSMKRLNVLRPERYPNLRLSLFCGEPLPVELARLWAYAAPNSVIENLYGPTELTIACTLYRWQDSSPDESENGVVPIGTPYPGMTARVVDDELNEVAPGQVGELIMAGPQVALGYWQDPAKTAAAFIIPPGQDSVYYRTGDLVRRPCGGRPLTFIGRKDNQVQIHGFRVELEEVEAILRQEAAVDLAVAVGWPLESKLAEQIIAFLGSDAVDLEDTRRRLESRLPGYMIPRHLRLMPNLPLTSNGKVDRKALKKLLADSREQFA